MLENHNDHTYEMEINVMPLYIPRVISVIAECPKIEVYLGNILEYDLTYYGDYIDTIEETKLFRFDVRIESNVTKASLKFIVKSDKLYIYGIHLALVKNPNPLGFPTKTIDFDEVQRMLSGSKVELSDKAKECKEHLAKSITNYKKPNDMEEKMAQMSLEQQEGIKSYIDLKLNDLEGKICQKFDDLESKQSEKLDQIFDMLKDLRK